MSTEKKFLQAVSTTMHLAPRRAGGHLDNSHIESLQRSEDLLLTLPARQMLEAFLEWNACSRPVFALNPLPSLLIPGTSPEDERTVHGRFGRSGFK